MATTAISLAGSCASASASSLGCGSLRKMVLSHPCTQPDSSLFFFLLPRSLQLAHHFSAKQTLLPSMCGHEELEIVSVKELPDGFLHFSFGVPANTSASSKVDGRSASCGERVAGTVTAAATPFSGRLPSKFSKKSPIPSAVQRRKRQGHNSGDQGKRKASTPSSSREAIKPISTARPNSCFVKRSPIPKRKIVQSATLPEDDVGDKVEKALREDEALMRPRSKFVRRSPVPASVARHHHAKALPSSTDEDSSTQVPTCVVRPQSAFSRRSPIATARRLRSSAVSTKEAHAPPISTSSDKSPPPVTESMDVVDLGKCKLAELKCLAKAKGLKGYSKLKKGELLDLLKKT